jgi:hypothetical protein
MTAPGSHPLVGQVQDLANRVHQLAGEAGRPELSAHLEEEARRYRSSETTVVVVGQAKRGKSSLIDALLDQDPVTTGPTPDPSKPKEPSPDTSPDPTKPKTPDPTPQNRPPTASNVTRSAKSSQERARVCVLQAASDPDGDKLTLTKVSAPSPTGKAFDGGAVPGESNCGQSVRFEWPSGWTGWPR